MAKRTSGNYRKNKEKALAANLESFGEYTCEYCFKAPLHKAQSGESTRRPDLATVDHVIALANNGSNSLSNLKVCCHDCNVKKGCSTLPVDKLNQFRYIRVYQYSNECNS
jgi:5-methylcytosine-specific restriction endonuclease McrA